VDKPLSLYEFNTLPQQQQFQYVWDKGVFLTNRIEDGSRFNLYTVGDFYVEVRYATADDMIKGIRTFRTTKPLDGFLDEISLSDVLKASQQ
jgi:hypothetical protein